MKLKFENENELENENENENENEIENGNENENSFDTWFQEDCARGKLGRIESAGSVGVMVNKGVS